MKNQKFIAVTKEIMEGLSTRKISGNGLKVYCVLRSYAPRIFPSVRVLAEKSGLNRKTVHKYLNILESLKVIKRNKRIGTSTIYEISPMLMDDKTCGIMRAFASKAVSEWHLRTNRYRSRQIPVPVSGSVTKAMAISMVTSVTLDAIRGMNPRFTPLEV